jgi:uncharacterized membrane protein
MADKDNPHFNQIYIFILITTTFSFLYIGAVTFLPISDKNQHIVDTVVGFLLGTVIGSAIGYLLGGNPASNKKDVSILPPDSETQVTTVSTEKEEIVHNEPKLD